MSRRIGTIEVFIQDIIDVFGEPDRGPTAGKGSPYKDVEWHLDNVARQLRLYTYKEKEYVSDQAVYRLHVGGVQGSQLTTFGYLLSDLGIEHSICWE